MAKKKGYQIKFCCDFRYLNSVTVKGAYPITRIDQSLTKLGNTKILTTLDLGLAFWQALLRKQDRDKTGFALRAGAVSMGKDALWSLQCHGYISTTDGTRIDKCNEEIWQPGDVLRGRRGNSDTYSRGPRLHEKSRTKKQAIEVRENQRLN